MVYPLADYQHCFFIFLCNNVSGMYRKCIAMYRACISSNWLLFYNSILHQTECHCVSNFRVSCSFRFIFQGSCFILFHYRVKIPSSVSKISQYHYTHENVFLCFHLRALCFHFQGFCFLAFPKCFSVIHFVSNKSFVYLLRKISHYHYTQSNSFLCSHLAHICSNIGGFVFCRSQNSFLVFSLFPK